MPFYDSNGKPLSSLSAYLGIESKQIIQVAGAGGKTTITAVLAGENRGKKVCVTTTTKRLRPDDNTFVIREGEKLTPQMLRKAETVISPDSLLTSNQVQTAINAKNKRNTDANIDNQNIDLNKSTDEAKSKTGASAYIEAGQFFSEEKICYPGKANLETLINWADLTLIEADGSRRLPLKCAYPHEPVFVQESMSVPVKTIIVAGLNSLGGKMKDVCYGYELVNGEISENETVTPEIMVSLLNRFFLHPFHHLHPYVVLSHADTPERMKTGIAISLQLNQNCVLMDVYNL